MPQLALSTILIQPQTKSKTYSTKQHKIPTIHRPFSFLSLPFSFHFYLRPEEPHLLLDHRLHCAPRGLHQRQHILGLALCWVENKNGKERERFIQCISE